LNPVFDLDEDGQVKLQPITGFAVAPVATIAVMIQVDYAESQAALETGDMGRKQFVLYPEQALELAEALKRAAGPLHGPLPLGNLIS
jgi:hypothetical protein